MLAATRRRNRGEGEGERKGEESRGELHASGAVTSVGLCN